MVQIVRGVYGHYIDGRVVAKDKNSEPFELSPEREERLVAAGVAEYVNLPDAAPDEDGETEAPIGFDEMPDELPEGVVGIPEYSVESSAKELREIGKLCDLTFPVGMTKTDMVAALDKYIEENTVEGVTVDEDGEITTDEEAPTFDAADAVVN